MRTRIKAYATISLLLVSMSVKGQRMPYTHQTDAGLLVGSPSVTSFSAQTFNGVTIRKWNLDAGITTGIDLYEQVIILPVSAGLKWNPYNSHTVSPVISLNGGYGFPWPQGENDHMKYQGGAIVNPSIGLRIKTKSMAKINVAFGIRQQTAVIGQPIAPVNYDSFGKFQDLGVRDEYKFRRFSVSLGLSF